MAAPARFLFDQDFAAPPPPPPSAKVAEVVPEKPKVELDYHLAEVAVAEAKARDKGVAEGRRAAEVRAAERLADQAALLVASSRALLAALDADRLAIEKQAVDLALIAARKLSAGLVDREPTAPIRELLAECLGPLRKAPHMVLRLAPQHADAVRGEVDRIARETGFEGRIVILGEPDLKAPDCRIEWADGGIVRDVPRLSRTIDEAVERYFAARAAGIDSPPRTEPVPATGRT